MLVQEILNASQEKPNLVVAHIDITPSLGPTLTLTHPSQWTIIKVHEGKYFYSWTKVIRVLYIYIYIQGIF